MNCIVTHAGPPCTLLTLPDSSIMYQYNVSKQDTNTHTCIVYHGMNTALWTCMHLTCTAVQLICIEKRHDGEDDDINWHVVCLLIASLGKDLSSSIMQCIICDRRGGPYLCHLSA